MIKHQIGLVCRHRGQVYDGCQALVLVVERRSDYATHAYQIRNQVHRQPWILQNFCDKVLDQVKLEGDWNNRYSLARYT
jgi:hypothetical protein